MMKLKVNGFEELAALLPKGTELSRDAQCHIKGGCSSCEDTRRPPKKNGKDRDDD